MGWTHIFADIGKGALKVGSVAGQAIGGPLGALVTIGSNVGLAELDHGPGKGEEKAQQVLVQAENAPVIVASAATDKAAQIRRIIDAIVQILNGLAALFPETPPKPPAAT